MSEVVFFEDTNIKVTNSRFISFGKTYALSGINSFRSGEIDETESREIYKLVVFGLCIWALFQGLSLAESKGGSITTLIFIVVCISGAIWWGVSAKQKIKFILLLTTSSGEVEALHSYTPGYIEKVESALSQAIVHRG